MKVLREGKAHKRDIMKVTCQFCESELRIIYGDPRSHRDWSGHDEVQHVLTFKCPVCGQLSTLKTYHDHSRDEFELIENAFLTIEDKKEIESWGDDPLTDLTDDELDELYAWDHARKVRKDLKIEWDDPDDRFI